MSGGGRIGRRDFLGGALGLAGAGLAGGRTRGTFPKGFHWGAATAAYQIEGAAKEDGRGESIWDRFSHTPGKVKYGDTGDVACDHYHRWREDVALMKRLNLTSYRFSIAWPRVQPTGHGAPNPKGVDFYSRLVDELLAKNIRPFPTLYHWDLPQALEDAGGWTHRDTAARFADYAGIVAKALGDRVRDWIVFNEPGIFVLLGYGIGLHAPGKADFPATLRASHVVNLAQGDAVRAIRTAVPRARVGGAWNMTTMEPATESEADKDAARRWQAFWNSWYLDPALRGRYPDAFPMGVPLPLMGVEEGDVERTRAAFDFIGVNHYNRLMVSATPPVVPGAIPGQPAPGQQGAKTDIGWEVWPRGFHDVVMWAWKEYGLPIEITENGAAYNDGPDASGRIKDARRVAFYESYLSALADAMREGADVRGYHAWSLLDNFEWAEGYSQRFGLVHVDYKTQKRTIKDSGRWYGRVAAGNALVS